MPGIDLEMGWEARWCRGRRGGGADGVGTAGRTTVRGGGWRRGDAEVREVVEIVQAVEELEVEGCGGLPVDMLGRISRGHFELLFVAFFCIDGLGRKA